MVRTITLSDGKKIPAIAWGSGTGGLSSAGEKAVEIGVWAIEAGIRHLDCAQVRPSPYSIPVEVADDQSYGTEAENGAAIKKSGVPRSEIFMTTKGKSNPHMGDWRQVADAAKFPPRPTPKPQRPM